MCARDCSHPGNSAWSFAAQRPNRDGGWAILGKVQWNSQTPQLLLATSTGSASECWGLPRGWEDALVILLGSWPIGALVLTVATCLFPAGINEPVQRCLDPSGREHNGFRRFLVPSTSKPRLLPAPQELCYLCRNSWLKGDPRAGSMAQAELQATTTGRSKIFPLISQV